jgi:hypothetical protein
MSANNQDIRKPEKGQESNENWDDQPQKNSDETKGNTATTQAIEDQHASTSASSQRNKRDNVGPLDADLEQLPSEKRMPDSNKTGPGIG